MLKKLILALGASTPVLLVGNVLAATLPNLTPGSQFRYVFVTSGTTAATSTDINTYNTFVNNAASIGSETSGITGPWRAIGSTATVSARDNTTTNPPGGVPIYRIDGELVANDYSDLWAGSISNPINVSENGTSVSPFVWTGSNEDGTISPFSLGSGSFLTTLGSSSQTNSLWMDGPPVNASAPFSLYAMSPIQEIPPDPVIPEPTTIIASLLVGAGLLPLKRRRQKTK